MSEKETEVQLADIADALIVHRSNILACQIRIALNPTEADRTELNRHIALYEQASKSYRALSGENPVTPSVDEKIKAQDPLITLLTDWLKREGKLDGIDLQKLNDPTALAAFRESLSENMQHAAQPHNKLRLFGDGGLRIPVTYGMFCRESQGSDKNEILRVCLTREETKTIRENLPVTLGKIPEKR